MLYQKIESDRKLSQQQQQQHHYSDSNGSDATHYCHSNSIVRKTADAATLSERQRTQQLGQDHEHSYMIGVTATVSKPSE